MDIQKPPLLQVDLLGKSKVRNVDQARELGLNLGLLHAPGTGTMLCISDSGPGSEQERLIHDVRVPAWRVGTCAWRRLCVVRGVIAVAVVHYVKLRKTLALCTSRLPLRWAIRFRI